MVTRLYLVSGNATSSKPNILFLKMSVLINLYFKSNKINQRQYSKNSTGSRLEHIASAAINFSN